MEGYLDEMMSFMILADEYKKSLTSFPSCANFPTRHVGFVMQTLTDFWLKHFFTLLFVILKMKINS
jgi:hypothetical protein